MRTAVSLLALILSAATLPLSAQDADTSEFDEAFSEETAEASAEAATDVAAEAAAEMEYHEATFGEWKAIDGATAEGNRRVFMRKELAPERFLDFDLFEGGMASVTFLDPECNFSASFDVQELGTEAARALAERYEDLLDTGSCDARDAVPSAEELAEPLAQLTAWVAERPFPAAGYWRAETRPLELGRGEGRGVSRYEGTVGIVYLEPDAESRGPAELKVSIYQCDAFDGRTLAVPSRDPADAEAMALTVLERHAAACGLEPEAPARLSAGLAQGFGSTLADFEANDAARQDAEIYEPLEPEENDPLDAQTY